MGIDYYKCDVCGECIGDCSDTVHNIADSDKSICNSCLEKHLEETGLINEICFSYDGEPGIFNSDEELLIQYTPFSDNKKLKPTEGRYIIRAGEDKVAKDLLVYKGDKKLPGVTAIEVIPHVFYEELYK